MSDASRDIAAVKYRADKYVDYGKDNTETLAELFVSFFAHICAIKKLFRNAANGRRIMAPLSSGVRGRRSSIRSASRTRSRLGITSRARCRCARAITS